MGSWPSDLCDKILECRTLSAPPNSYLDTYHEKLAIGSILRLNSGDVNKERLAREVAMVHLAGEDCAIPVVGRHNHGAINEFITRLGKSLIQGQGDDISPEIFERGLSVIQQFCALLHSKGIIYETLAPNVLLHSDESHLSPGTCWLYLLVVS